MAITKLTTAFHQQGFAPGDEVWRAEAVRDEDWQFDSEVVGYFRLLADAKSAAELNIAGRKASPKGWWYAIAAHGTIEDRSFDDGPFGYVNRWTFEAFEADGGRHIFMGDDWEAA